MKRKIESIRWALADYLSRTACWLRGHKWYVADTWHGVPGNRAAELRQRIWVNFVMTDWESDALPIVDHDLTELAQLAGENWGHVWPREPK